MNKLNKRLTLRNHEAKTLENACFISLLININKRLTLRSHEAKMLEKCLFLYSLNWEGGWGVQQAECFI